MCERKSARGRQCSKPSAFFVFVQVQPQERVVCGVPEMERSPAGRSQNVCHSHLAPVVRELYALQIRLYGKGVVVRPL